MGDFSNPDGLHSNPPSGSLLLRPLRAPSFTENDSSFLLLLVPYDEIESSNEGELPRWSVVFEEGPKEGSVEERVWSEGRREGGGVGDGLVVDGESRVDETCHDDAAYEEDPDLVFCCVCSELVEGAFQEGSLSDGEGSRRGGRR